MGLIQSSTFKGSPIYDCDPDSITYRRVIANAIEDLHGAEWHATSTADAGRFIDHSGGGRGALIGNPWVNQSCDFWTRLDNEVDKNGGIVSASDTIEFHWIVRVEPGETRVVCDFVMDGYITVTFIERVLPRVRLSSLTNVATAVSAALEVPLTWSAADQSLHGEHVEVTAGLHLLSLRFTVGGWPAYFLGDGNERDNQPSVLHALVYKGRGGRPTAQRMVSTSNPMRVPVPGTGLHRGGQLSFDDTTYASGAISSWHVSRLDGALSALEEWASGAEGGGQNATFVATEDALTPTYERFRNPLSRRQHGLMPMPILPIKSICAGGIKGDGGYLCNIGVTSNRLRPAYGPYIINDAAPTWNIYARDCSLLPDANSGALRWAMVFGSSTPVAPTNYRARIAMNGLAASASTTPTAVLGTMSTLWFAQGAALAFAGNTSNEVRIEMQRAAGAAVSNDMCLLSYALWLEL